MRKCYESEGYKKGYEDGRKSFLKEVSNVIKITSREDVEAKLKFVGNLNGLCYVTEERKTILLNYHHHNNSGMSVNFVIDLSKGEVDFDKYKVDKGLYFSRAEELQYQVRDLADLLRDVEEDLGKLVKAKIIKL